MKRILFLDDDLFRHHLARQIMAEGNSFHSVFTVDDAIDALEFHPPYDQVFLDHDLTQGEYYVDSNRRDCGYEVVRWILVNRPTIGEVIVHTLHTSAGNQMAQELKRAGYNARYHSFQDQAREKGLVS